MFKMTSLKSVLLWLKRPHRLTVADGRSRDSQPRQRLSAAIKPSERHDDRFHMSIMLSHAPQPPTTYMLLAMRRACRRADRSGLCCTSLFYHLYLE